MNCPLQHSTCSYDKCMFPPLSTIIEVQCLVIPSQTGIKIFTLSTETFSITTIPLDYIKSTFAEKTSRYEMNWNKVSKQSKVQHTQRSTTYMCSKHISCSKCLSLKDIVTTVSFIFSDDKRQGKISHVL